MELKGQDREKEFHSSVKRAVLSEAVQHPTTLFPAAVSLLATAQMVLMNPTPEAFATALISGFLMVSSFIFHYVVRGEKVAAKFAMDYKNQREKEHLSGLEAIVAESRRTGFQMGVKEGQEFETAYLQLTRYLKNLNDSTPERASRFLDLAEDCYRQGLNILHDALETHKVVFTFPISKLKEEHLQWTDQLEDIKKLIAHGKENLTIKKEALESKIKNHQVRIDTYQDKRDRLEQLMAEMESLESALETAYLEVVDLISGKTLKNFNIDPANRLEKAVSTAKRVEDRLTSMTGGNPEEDQIYKDAAN